MPLRKEQHLQKVDWPFSIEKLPQLRKKQYRSEKPGIVFLIHFFPNN